MELQQTLMQHNKVKHQTDGRIQLNERAKRRDQLTVQELKSLPQSARTYASVGRMFVKIEISLVCSFFWQVYARSKGRSE